MFKINILNGNLVKIDRTYLINQDLAIGWDGRTFTSKITDSNNYSSNYYILRDLSNSNNVVVGFGFDNDGLYALVDSTKIYILTK